MLPWYSKVYHDCRYSTVEEIRFSDLKDKLVRIELFSMTELIKLYPNFKKVGEYIIFNKDLFFNYKNYLLFENNLNFGGHGEIVTFKTINEYDLIRGSDFKLCTFLKYPFKDMYIQSGLYIYNWMIKKIAIYPMIKIDNRRVVSARPRLRNEIDTLISFHIRTHKNRSYHDFKKHHEFKQIVETQDGFVLNW
jgi:hypothetical protein